MPLGIYNSNAFQNASGVQVVPNANVEVRKESDSGLADIFSDRAGSSAIAQVAYPGTIGFKAGANGYFEFYAEGRAGGYQIRIYSDDLSLDKTVRYQATGNARERDASDYGAGLMNAADAPAARVLLDVPSVLASWGALVNGYLAWSVASNVLTVAVKTLAGQDPSAADPVAIIFRSTTAADGLPAVLELTAATSIAINDTALLGTLNSTAFRLWCVAFDDGGTVRLAIINCLAGTAPSLNIFPLAGWGIASSTLEDNASDSAHVFYSAGAAVAAKAYATLGYATWEAGLATAGTWSTGPTRAQMFGPGVPLPGQTIQTQRTQTGAVATGTTIIPLDDTIPQNTEGNEYMTRAITPSSAANLLRISSLLQLNHNNASAQNLISALFQDTAASALAVTCTVSPSQFFEGFTPLNHAMRAGTSSQTTMKVRSGPSSAATITFNGRNAGREFGGVMNSFLEVVEVMA